MCVCSQSELVMEDCTVGMAGLHGDCGWTVELDWLQGVNALLVEGETVAGNSSSFVEFEGTMDDSFTLGCERFVLDDKEVLSD